MAESVFERVAWSNRSRLFRSLRAYDDGRPIVVMEFAPVEADRIDEWMWLRHLWLELPPHPQMLDAIDRCVGALYVRYAALDWKRESLRLDVGPLARQVVASWGVDVTRVFAHIVAHAPTTELGHYLRPFVKIDLANTARVGFLPVRSEDDHVPPEVRDIWPSCDERALVHVIGGVIRDAAEAWHDDEPIVAIVKRCLATDPMQRYATLAELRDALSAIAPTTLRGDRLEAWQRAEEGFGWLEVSEPDKAFRAFLEALQLRPQQRLARTGFERVMKLRSRPGSEAIAYKTRGFAWSRSKGPRLSIEPMASIDSVPSRLDWTEVSDRGRGLEAEHDPAGALALYRCVRIDETSGLIALLAVARCQLALGDTGPAIDHARRAAERAPSSIEAKSIIARAFLRAKRLAEALATADDWLAIAPDDGAAHYIRGRALFSLGRPIEARDAFDRAFALDPMKLEAFLLRREADRAARRVAARVGDSKPMTLDLPDRLAALREPLAAGRLREVIPVLEQAIYDNDAVAKLLLADCLAFEQRYADAIAVYDRALSIHRSPKAVLGKITALLALDRVAEAIAVLDTAGDLVDTELVEARALALRRLGLVDDAEREDRRVAAASHDRSDLRIGRH